jgi:hypothetical protein
MRFTIRGWLLLCVPLGLVCAIMQRPLRTPEFVQGMLVPLYPLLWLCYCEDIIGKSNPSSPTEFCGTMFTGMSLLVLVSGGLSYLIERAR